MNVEHTPHQPPSSQSNSLEDSTPQAQVPTGQNDVALHPTTHTEAMPPSPPIEGSPLKPSLPTFRPKPVHVEPDDEANQQPPATEEATVKASSRGTVPVQRSGFWARILGSGASAKRQLHAARRSKEAGLPLTSPSDEESIPSLQEATSREPSTALTEPLDDLFPGAVQQQTPTPAAYAKLRRRVRQHHVWMLRLVEVTRLALVLATLYGLYDWVSQPGWYIHSGQVQFENNRMVQTPMLQQRMSRYMGGHLLLLNPSEISQHLKTDNQLLAHVQVKRQVWPEPRLIVRVSEHRLWGLVHDPWEKPKIMAWHRNPKHKPEALIPPPYAFVVGNYENRRFASSSYRLPRRALTTPYTLMFVDTKWYRGMKQELRKALLGDVDRIVHGLLAMPGIQVSSLTIDKARNLEVDVLYQGAPILLKAGTLDATIFKRLARLKPTLHVVDNLNKAMPDSLIDRIDARWSENVYLHRVNGETHTDVEDEVPTIPPRA